MFSLRCCEGGGRARALQGHPLLGVVAKTHQETKHLSDGWPNTPRTPTNSRIDGQNTEKTTCFSDGWSSTPRKPTKYRMGGKKHRENQPVLGWMVKNAGKANFFSDGWPKPRENQLVHRGIAKNAWKTNCFPDGWPNTPKKVFLGVVFSVCLAIHPRTSWCSRRISPVIRENKAPSILLWTEPFGGMCPPPLPSPGQIHQNGSHP